MKLLPRHTTVGLPHRLALCAGLLFVGCVPRPTCGNGVADPGELCYAAPTSYEVGHTPVSLEAGDLDGDGDIDLLTPGMDAGSLTALFNQGDGTFAAQVSFPVEGVSLLSAALGDFDRDGDVDLAFAGLAQDGTTRVGLLLNDGGGAFAQGAVTPLSKLPVSVALGDLDGDALPDVVAALAYAVAEGDLVHVRGDAVAFINHAGVALYPPKTITQGDVTAVSLGDLDGDGDLDLVATNLEPDAVGVFRNNGGAAFDAVAAYPVGSRPRIAVLSDLDGDARLDITTPNMGSQGLSVLLGRGDGTFLPDVRVPVGPGLYSVEAGDLDADGDLDLVTANSSASTVWVFLQGEAGEFSRRLSFATEGEPVSVIVRDLNGDGLPDIATADRASDRVSVILTTP